MTPQNTDHSTSRPPTPLLTLRLLAIVTAALIAGLIVALLGYCAAGSIAVALLSGLGATGLTIERLHRWTENP